jgi:hypothetical protein
MFQLIIKKINSLLKKCEKNNNPSKNLNSSVMERVFIHLSGKDLLNCSMVNKNWNEVVSKSKEFSKKIKLNITESPIDYEKRLSVDDLRIIFRNGRKYEHLKIKAHKRLKYVHSILMASFKWKTVKIYDLKSLGGIELANFLGTIESTVEDLELKNIYVDPLKTKFSNQKNQLNYKFPKLKVLRIINSDTTFFLGNVFNMVEFLIELEIKTYKIKELDDSQRKSKSILKILSYNNYLKSLSLNLTQKDFDCLFSSSIKFVNLRFQLETLNLKQFRKVINASELVENENQIKNLKKFISYQKRSLRQLELGSWVGNEILEFSMNNLCLNYLLINESSSYGIHEDHIATMNIFKNETIEELIMLETESSNEFLQKTFLKALPFLKRLTIDLISQSTLDIIINSNDKIEAIRCLRFNAFYPPEYSVLPKLKEMIILEEYSRSFKDILRDCKNYTNFEKVFLEAVRKLDLNSPE